ncbi:hypothetical protein TNCV_3186261 [Trichonephila clavipes]|nr:hypothetical protein TNCV_3186261 [Trichonephila clavipes]
MDEPGLEHRTQDQKVWVRFPMPPNTLRVHTEYVLVKSVSPKVLLAESRVENISLSFSSCLNCGGGNRWCHHLSSLWDFLRAKLYCRLHGAQG